MTTEALEPNARNIECVMTCVIPPCPFCGTRGPILLDRANETTGIYRSIVHCTNYHCDAELGFNARDRREAQDGAVERWSKRAALARTEDGGRNDG